MPVADCRSRWSSGRARIIDEQHDLVSQPVEQSRTRDCAQQTKKCQDVFVSRVCTICKHPQRLDIERELIAGAPLRDIAGRFGRSKTAVLRHKDHVSQGLKAEQEAHEAVRSRTLLDDIRAGERRADLLYARAEEILTAALQQNNSRSALQAIRAATSVMGEARAYLALRGELVGDLGRDRSAAPVSVQIIVPIGTERKEVPQATFSSPDAAQPIDEGVYEIGLLRAP